MGNSKDDFLEKNSGLSREEAKKDLRLKSSFKKKSYLISYTDSQLLHPRLKTILEPFAEPKPN